jgi:hypothetical protein
LATRTPTPRKATATPGAANQLTKSPYINNSFVPMHETVSALDPTIISTFGLRVDYVLPSADLWVEDSGVVYPMGPGDPQTTASGASDHRPVYIDFLLVPEAEELGGDYNGSGVVDAADSTVWRDSMETGTTALLNRDSSLGIDPVDEDDYAFWRANFGMSLGGSAPAGFAEVSSLQTAVPERGTVMLSVLAAVGLLLAQRQCVAELFNT